jgi:hypothetical protein
MMTLAHNVSPPSARVEGFQFRIEMVTPPPRSDNAKKSRDPAMNKLDAANAAV